jgi:dihydroorotase
MKEKKSASISGNRRPDGFQRPRSLLIRGGHVIDPANHLDGPADILIREGKIAAIGPKLKESAEETIDARELIVAPGFIDIHVHLREPGQAHKETIATGTAAAAAGGFTSVCAMPNTAPVNDSAEITAWMQSPERGAMVNVFPIAAATLGSQGEKLTDFAALRQAGAVGVSDDGKPILEDEIMRETLQMAKRVGFPVIQHAEDTRLTSGAAMNAGAVSFRLGLRGMPAEGEAGIVRRDIELAKKTGAHIHVAHISTAEAVDEVRRAKREGVNVTCEVTPHHFVLTDEAVAGYDTRYKMNPPLRTEADRQAMLAGLEDGTIDAIATDHAPHAHHEKMVEFDRAAFGITGLETALGLTISELHKKRGLPLTRIVELLSTNPGRILSVGGRGQLSVGAPADITIFDRKKQWTFDAKDSKSKSRNTPFGGWKLTGKVVTTIVSGVVVGESGKR